MSGGETERLEAKLDRLVESSQSSAIAHARIIERLGAHEKDSLDHEKRLRSLEFRQARIAVYIGIGCLIGSTILATALRSWLGL